MQEPRPWDGHSVQCSRKVFPPHCCSPFLQGKHDSPLSEEISRQLNVRQSGLHAIALEEMTMKASYPVLERSWDSRKLNLLQDSKIMLLVLQEVEFKHFPTGCRWFLVPDGPRAQVTKSELSGSLPGTPFLVPWDSMYHWINDILHSLL